MIEEVKQVGDPPPAGLAQLPAPSAKALAVATKKRAQQEKVRKRAKTTVEASAKMLAEACVTLLNSDLPDRFLRVGRLVRIGNALQLEMSDRVADLRARGGAALLGGGEYAPGGPNDALGAPLYGDYAPAYPGAVMVGQPPVADNVQLIRELIGQIGNVANKKSELPPREASPFDLVQAIDARKRLIESEQDTKELDEYIAGLKKQLARQGEAFDKGLPDPAAVAAHDKNVQSMKDAILHGAAGAQLTQGLLAHDFEMAHGQGAVPQGLLKAPILAEE